MLPTRSCPEYSSADFRPLILISSAAPSSWICWRQIDHRSNLYSTADPPEMPRAPDPYAPPVHRLQGALRYHRSEWAVEHHAAVRIPWVADTAVEGHYGRGAVQSESNEHAFGIIRITPGSEARGRTLLFAIQHRSGRCHAKGGARFSGKSGANLSYELFISSKLIWNVNICNIFWKWTDFDKFIRFEKEIYSTL